MKSYRLITFRSSVKFDCIFVILPLETQTCYFITGLCLSEAKGMKVFMKKHIIPLQKTKGFAEERRIFRYTLADAWEYTRSQVDVIEGVVKGNVRCLYFYTPGSYADTKVDSSIITVSHNCIDMIKNAMLMNLNICKYKEIEFPFVLDGFINTFEFSPGNSFSNKITAFNISAFRDGAHVAILGNPPYKGKEVLKLYEDISKILLDNGVSPKYLALDF